MKQAINKTQFISACEGFISESLIEAVISQFGGWDDFTESAADVNNHGIDGGFNGFIYYADTVRFADANLGAILSFARRIAGELGQDGAFSLIAKFDYLTEYNADSIAYAILCHSIDDDPWDDDFIQVMNALAWFAAEEVCGAYCDLLEELEK